LIQPISRLADPPQSVKDATLDQQCTVTRPGLAPIASALLVELLVSVLQHPRKGRAPAPAAAAGGPSSAPGGSHPADASSADATGFAHPLGLVPHQLRGFLSSFHTMQVVGQPYPQCSACSDAVVRAFEKDGWAFLRRALAEKGFVEQVSGLAEVQRRAEELDADVDWEGEDEDGELL
jgi:ubiquitin-like modifier-activating enzyme ATG7